MKKSIIYYLLLALMIFSGCKKYLEQAPDQRTQLNTPQKVSELLVTAYPRANLFLLTEAMSDNPIDNSISGAANAMNIGGYFWLDPEATSQDSPNYYWGACYTAIAAANQALDVCNNAANPEQYLAQKGEALVARAYAHFMLVTYYAKAYNPATSASDPGIPYVTEPENVVVKQYDRKTVAFVYEQIEKDLKEGLPLIADNYTVPAYHFNKKAAHAFAARFYLNKRDYDQVIAEAALAFPSNDFAANVRPWFSYASLDATETRVQFRSSSNPGNLLIAETVSNVSGSYNNTRYSLSQAKLTSIRTPVGVLLSAYRTYSNSSTFYYVNKFMQHFVRSSINATTGTGYVMVAVLTTEELLLNRAEAYAMKENYTAALADMNAFISTRVNGYVPATHNLTENKIKTYYNSKTTDTKEAFVMAVLDLKRAEFVHEGIRWLDIKRLNLPVTHIDMNGTMRELQANDPRRLLQLPPEVTLSGVQLNPR
jgi:hypothetical protein